MTIARNQIIDAEQPCFYHCFNRCVQRARLCGFDPITGKNFNHRKIWIEERIIQLSNCFSIDLYAYAVMDNHYHIVLLLDPKGSANWSDDEVVERWLNTRTKPMTPNAKTTQKAALLKNAKKVKEIRERLSSLSWFMSKLNTPIASMSNKEDDVTGHFWASRFQSIPLLDETAAIACMAYTDLNPLKAGAAQSLSKSKFTSIQKRLLQSSKSGIDSTNHPIKPLNSSLSIRPLHTSLSDYLEMVSIAASALQFERKNIKFTEELLKKLSLHKSIWPLNLEYFGSVKTAIGSPKHLRKIAKKRQQHSISGIRLARKAYDDDKKDP